MKFIALSLFSLFVGSLTIMAQSGSTAEVLNMQLNNQNLVIVSGYFVNSKTGDALQNVSFRLNDEKPEIVSCAIDKNGRYVIAVDKRYVENDLQIRFKIDGYKKTATMNIPLTEDLVYKNIALRENQNISYEQADKTVYMTDEPFSVLVWKF